MVLGTSDAGDPRAGEHRVRIGYARVSKREMNLALQVAELKRAGCTKIFTDKISALADDRPARAKAIAALKPGDQLVVWKLDRFARDLLDQLMGLRDIQLRGGSFVTLTEVIDTSDWMGRVMSRQLAIYAEVEFHRITERTRQGVKQALADGVRFGRKPALTTRKLGKARRLIAEGQKVETVAADMRVGRSTLFRYLAQGHPDTKNRRDASG